MADLIELYLANFSAATQRSYRATLTEWSDYVGDFSKATRRQAIGFFAAQGVKEGATPRRVGVSTTVTRQTIERKRVILKSFYRFIAAEGVGDSKIFDFPMQVGEQKPAKRPTECLPLDKVEALLEVGSSHTREGLRDRAILAQMLFTGCRRQEVLNLDINHVRRRSDGLVEILSVTTKGGEPMVRIVPEQAGTTILKYQEMRLAECGSSEGPMYPTYRGKTGHMARISPKWLWRHFKQWCREAGIDPDWVSPHSARVTVVTKLLSDGHDYGAVATVTGHKSLEVVRRYDARFRAAKDSPALKIKW